MDKETQKKLAKIFVLIDLLVTEIDEPTKQPTPETKKIQDKSMELQKLLEPVLSRFYNGSPKQTTFFIELQRKFNYIFDKEYK